MRLFRRTLGMGEGRGGYLSVRAPHRRMYHSQLSILHKKSKHPLLLVLPLHLRLPDQLLPLHDELHSLRAPLHQHIPLQRYPSLERLEEDVQYPTLFDDHAGDNEGVAADDRGAERRVADRLRTKRIGESVGGFERREQWEASWVVPDDDCAREGQQELFEVVREK